MIGRLQLAEWASTSAPWSTPQMVEQDLMLSRLIVEIANHDVLSRELRMRGGTCLHKVVLPQPGRYSQDLDYVRATRGPAGLVFDAVREVVAVAGLDVASTERIGGMIHLVLHAESSTRVAPCTIKVEINVEETSPRWDIIDVPFRVESSWWSGEARVPTFKPDELMGTKLRALFQRSKGRDLYDLWLVLGQPDVMGERIADAFHHYMGDRAFTYPMLRQNLMSKLADSSFTRDMVELLPLGHVGWDPVDAADHVMEQVGAHLRNAPPIDEIRGGRWRVGAT